MAAGKYLSLRMLNSVQRQYVFGAILIAFSIYQATIKDYLEVALYAAAGLAFVINAMTFEHKLNSYKKYLVMLAWAFIAATGLLFLYMIQFKWF
jgi:hypothetical protein